MMIARKNMEVGQVLPPLKKDVTFENIRLFSMWSNRNIHTDWEIAIKGGLPAPIAQGLMSHAYLAEMLTGVVKEKVEEGAAVRFNCDVWCESLSGEKTVVGTASCLVN
jgi:acyl dehydratase